MIAERHLNLIDENGELRDIVVRIGRPEPSPNGSDYACEFQIIGLFDGMTKRIHGVDAFQSLQLTLRFIATMLHHYRQEAQGRIYWLEPGDDMGFGDPETSP